MPLSCWSGKPIVNVVAVVAPLGLTGATVIIGVMLSDQLSSMPVVPVLELVSWSVQTPGTHMAGGILHIDRMAVQGRERARGLIRPVKGAVPVVIEFSAVSSKTVLTKFEPVPPTPENKGTWVPSGAIRTAVRSESGENAALSSTRDLGNRERAVVARDRSTSSRACRDWSSSSRRGLSGRCCCSTGSTADRRSSRSGP